MLYPRFILPKILEALAESPVILVSGARQTGKTTLVQQLASEHYAAQYLNLEELKPEHPYLLKINITISKPFGCSRTS